MCLSNPCVNKNICRQLYLRITHKLFQCLVSKVCFVIFPEIYCGNMDQYFVKQMGIKKKDVFIFLVVLTSIATVSIIYHFLPLQQPHSLTCTFIMYFVIWGKGCMHVNLQGYTVTVSRYYGSWS